MRVSRFSIPVLAATILVAAGLTAPSTASALDCSQYTGPGKIVVQTDIAKKSHRVKTRPLSVIDAVVIHATGFRWKDLRPKKVRNVKAHYVVLHTGQIIQNHPYEAFMWASNKLSRRSLAIEFMGNYKSDRGKCYKASKFGCHTAPQAQIDAGRCLLKYIRSKLSTVNNVFAHRQSSYSRGNDPGPEVWCNVGEYGIRNLGMDSSGADYKIGSGRAIPAKWQSACGLPPRTLGQTVSIAKRKASNYIRSAYAKMKSWIYGKIGSVISFFTRPEAFINARWATMRAEPSSKGKRIKSLRNCTKVKIVTKSGKYVRIDYNGTYGYVYWKYVVPGDKKHCSR